MLTFLNDLLNIVGVLCASPYHINKKLHLIRIKHKLHSYNLVEKQFADSGTIVLLFDSNVTMTETKRVKSGQVFIEK